MRGDDLPRPEYPRPNLTRSEWLNLNGTWRFAVDSSSRGLDAGWHLSDLPGTGTIVVPYAPNSEASGATLNPTESTIWYQREFSIPGGWEGKSICLNFGAVDYFARVFINGEQVGEHSGGYTPFTIDITHALVSGENALTVQVQDSLSWTQPRGKQAGTTRWPIDYDGVTGIWQTVWLEPVTEDRIVSIYPRFSLASSTLSCLVGFSTHVEGEVSVEVRRGEELVASSSATVNTRSEARVEIDIESPSLWSPDQPFLYDLAVTLRAETGSTDCVKSYAGLREIGVSDGRLLLNGSPLYLRGVLDQGYFPGGWYTPLTDDAIKQDVELTIAMGFNCARKHQKIEDPRYLYWADRLGLLVWAEMPSGRIFSTELQQSITHEWIDVLQRDRGHPCIITWVPFNESWGVWNQATRPEQRAFVDSVVSMTKALDPSRPVVGNDGWEFSSGDLWTLHVYQEDSDLSVRIGGLVKNPHSMVIEGENGLGQRAGALPGSDVQGLPVLLTECGGFGFGRYSAEDFSYGEMPQTVDELESRIREAISIIEDIDVLCGFVWTQLSDVQQEINGLLYFDRKPKLTLEKYQDLFGNRSGPIA